jgi:hypothetical protein
MAHKKKKNGADQSRRNLMIRIGIVCLLALFFIWLLFKALMVCGCSDPDAFNQTMTAVVATNDHVATLIMQTNVAATEQFNVTNTPLP